MKSNLPSKTFCALPWLEVATSPRGTIRVCCNGDNDASLITKDTGSGHFKIYRDRIDDYWNSDCYRTIRRQLLEGTVPRSCTKCFAEEAAGLQSPRQSSNLRWQNFIEATSTFTEIAKPEIRYLDLRLGNKCNLRCRMCGPDSSSMWSEEWARLFPNRKIGPIFDWTETDIFWENLKSLSPSLEEIYLTGGEPMLIERQISYLDFLIEENLSEKIRLKYNTNLTLYNAEIVKRWPHFRSVLVNCSVDGFGKVNDLIRYPSKWDVIINNLNKYSMVKNAEVQIYNTVQVYNIFYLDTFLDWALDLGFKLYFNILSEPSCLNIRVLSLQQKQLIYSNLKGYFSISRIAGIVEYMNSADLSQLWPDFLTFNQALDRSRGQKSEEVIPKLFESLLIE